MSEVGVQAVRTEYVSPEMRLVGHGPQIDLSPWNWGDGYDEGALGVLMKGAAAKISEVMRQVFREHPPELTLPIGWSPRSDGLGGKPVEDPATLYVAIPLGPVEEDYVHYALSLETCIDDLIELNEGRPEGRTICAALAARLRQLADKLDKACSEDVTA